MRREPGADDGLRPLPPLLQWDLETVAWFARTKEELPWLRAAVHATTSRRRTQDLSVLLWLVFLLAVYELGLAYMWICIWNLSGALLLQYLVHLPRPIDFDRSLYSRLHTDPDTHGFPCVDSHMSVVVLLPVVLQIPSQLLRALLVAVALWIGLAKLFVATRFVSQVAGSYLTGVAGLLAGNHGHALVRSYKFSHGHNAAAIVALVVFLMLVVGSWIENNESHVLGIPKQDYLDVLGNILGSEAPVVAPTPRDASAYTDSGDAFDEDDGEEEERAIAGKRDSFYFLMKSMQTRERRRRRQRDAGGTTGV